jgi:hypothetical protein
VGPNVEAGTGPDTLQHCRNPKVGRALAPAFIQEDKRPVFALPTRLSDREHEQGMPGVWAITKSPCGNRLTIDTDRCEQTLLCRCLWRQQRSKLNVRVKKSHVVRKHLERSFQKQPVDRESGCFKPAIVVRVASEGLDLTRICNFE